MLTKAELDNRVAVALGLPSKRVSAVTDAFIDELCASVVEHGGFHLTGLGKLVLNIERGANQLGKDVPPDSMRIRLYFTKSRTLKEQIERRFGMKKEANMNKTNQSDEGMTKYAVNEGHNPDKLEKAAAQGCPICAAPVVKHGRVFACPTHGTEPFE
jgi:nucleoid DNA-binding protein